LLRLLRSFLRQDPDIIMVGEIRDFETAEIAVKAALTGHLVLSTLHTNDAPSTVTRLLNMGVEPFLVTASVNLVVAQRLARKICQECKVQVPTDEQVLLDVGFPEKELPDVVAFRGTGCKVCNDTGYKGRVALQGPSRVVRGHAVQGSAPRNRSSGWIDRRGERRDDPRWRLNPADGRAQQGSSGRHDD
jgi:type II secretory ATPase GspE/PulE/Tfp pilus assembly ATPase PilB-like protein